MEKDWQLERLERRVDALEEENRRRSERRMRLESNVIWTFYVIVITTVLVLGITGQLHHQ